MMVPVALGENVGQSTGCKSWNWGAGNKGGGCIASAKYGQDAGEWEGGRRKSGSLG